VTSQRLKQIIMIPIIRQISLFSTLFVREQQLTGRLFNIDRVTKRLILAAFVSLFILFYLFHIPYIDYQGHERFMVSYACFGCGTLGGFISVQQRLKTVGDDELKLLSNSWSHLLLKPIFGGIFALILYVGVFLGQIIKGGGPFPEFYIPPFPSKPTNLDIHNFFSETYPKSGPDLAKLLFWCVVAGFSERFIPEIISKTPSSSGGIVNSDVEGPAGQTTRAALIPETRAGAEAAAGPATGHATARHRIGEIPAAGE